MDPKEHLRNKLQKLALSNKPKYPSTIKMIQNAGQSAVSVIRNINNGVKLSGPEAEKRLNICKSCPFFNTSSNRCSQCGCNMSIKTYLKALKCPVGKW